MTSTRFVPLLCASAALAAVYAACGGNVVVDTGQVSSTGGGGGTGAGVSSPGAGGSVVSPAGGYGGVSTGPVMTDATSDVSSSFAASTVSATVSTSTSTSSGASCSSQTAPSGPCSPGASCASAGSPCLAVAPQNGAPSFGLRVSHVTVTQPATLAAGVVASTFENAVTPNLQSCNLAGEGTFSWLLQFDTNLGKLITGGAAPIASATGAYSFVSQTIQGFPVQPVGLAAPFTGCSVGSSGGDVVLPLYLDAAGTMVVLLPLHQLRFRDGTVTDDNSCIGVYNAGGLDPANNCQPDVNTPGFLDGAAFDAYFEIAETDKVTIAALDESLCVLLSGNSQTYGMQAAGSSEIVCKRDTNDQIVFQGDWCSTTNAAATTGCADAVRFRGTFSASGVNIQ